MKRLIYLMMAVLCLATPAHAADEAMVLAAGGGYKKMVNALAKVYEAQTGNSVQLIYGNMGRVTAQAKNSGAVDIVLGANFFFKRAKLDFARVEELGRGRLVLAWPKTGRTVAPSKTELRSDEVKRIALPDTSKAIYGRAAKQYLQRSGLIPDVQSKLVVVSTVPQVFSYLSINEVDFGFLNLTHALNVRKSLGGFVEIPQDDYDPIRIVVGELKGARHPKQVTDFYQFLASDQARKIVRDNGL